MAKRARACEAGVLPQLADQRCTQLVGPVGHDGAQPLLDFVHHRVAHVGPEGDADVQAGQRAHADQDLVLGSRPSEGRLKSAAAICSARSVE